MISGISEKNRKLLDELNRAQKGPFSIKDAAETLNAPPEDIRVFLAYFARKGWLSRVKRGLYITVPLGTINPQDYREHPWVVADKVFSPCYIGGWSAAEHWELTDQIFNSIIVFTSRKFRNKNIKIQGTDFILKFITKKHFGKTKTAWIENNKIKVSNPLQTIVDILDGPFIGGGMRHIMDIIKTYFDSEYRDDTLMCDYIEEKKNQTVYKRLGYLIEVLNINAPELIKKCKKNISKGYSLLDPTIGPKGPFNRGWNLRINIQLKE